MKIGTKTLLFGVHQFLIHPIYVAKCYIRLYEIPVKLPVWIAFFLHDIGYWGCKDIDGKEGKKHPKKGAVYLGDNFEIKYYLFSVLHSRHMVNEFNEGEFFCYYQPSKLCYADKLAFCAMPFWLYYVLSHLTGEYKEYLTRNGYNTHNYQSFKHWHRKVRYQLLRFVAENQNNFTDYENM